MDLNLLQRETALPVDTVRTRWKHLSSLPPTARGVLDVGQLSGAWNVDVRSAVDFLWSCVRAGGVKAAWQRVNLASGWVIDEAETLAGLQAGPLHDPFTGADVLPDVGQGARVVFSLLPEAYTGPWSAYARFRHAGSDAPVPAWSKVLQPWEVGRLDIDAVEGGVYQVVCLENRSTLTLMVDSAKVIGGRSFIGKMKQYRAQKFLLSLQRRVIDLKVTESGFETENTLIPPGPLVYWLENKTEKPVMVQFWPERLPTARSVELKSDGLDSLASPAWARQWPEAQMAERAHWPVCGLVYLHAEFSGSELLLHGGDAKCFTVLASACEVVAAHVSDHAGFLTSRSSLGFNAAFSSPQAAFGAALAIRASNRASPLSCTVSLTAGPVLLVNEEHRPQLFGFNLHLAGWYQKHASAGDLWVSLAFWSSPGVEAAFDAAGLKAETVMLSVIGPDQKVLAYRISASEI